MRPDVQPKSEVVWKAWLKSIFDDAIFLFLLATTLNKMVSMILQLREKKGQHKTFLVPKAKNQNWQNFYLILGKTPWKSLSCGQKNIHNLTHMHKAGLTRSWEDLRFGLRRLWSRFWHHWNEKWKCFHSKLCSSFKSYPWRCSIYDKRRKENVLFFYLLLEALCAQLWTRI